MSKLKKEIYLSPKAFENMPNLKFLKIYNSKVVEGVKKEECKVHLSQGLDYLPNELRYLYWYGYPLEFLPVDFFPENPLTIELPYSNIKELCKDVESESIVRHCSPLSQLSMVTCLRLENCSNLTRLPSNVDMGCLDTLDLSGCKRLEMFPEVSRNVRYLYLRETAIKEVPSYVENLDQLVELNLERCLELASLPTNICKLKHLKFLDLGDCFKLKVFPEISESMDNLERLNLSWTAIKELPSSVDNLKGLKWLSTEGCEILASITSWLGMSCLTSVNLVYCDLWELPANLGCLSTLNELSLGGNHFESIPESIKQLAQLQFLSIENCRRLQSLPELPVSLVRLHASGCTSLKNISSLDRLLSDKRTHLCEVNLSECFKVHESARDPISQLGTHFLDKHVINHNDEKLLQPSIFVCYPGGRIPEWCVNQGTGDTVRVPLPSDWLNNDPYLGFIICLVVQIDFLPKIQLQCSCHFGDDCDDGSDFTFVLNEMSTVENVANPTEPVIMLFACSLYGMIAEKCPRLTQCSYNAVLFNFKPFERSILPYWTVEKCGVIPFVCQR